MVVTHSPWVSRLSFGSPPSSTVNRSIRAAVSLEKLNSNHVNVGYSSSTLHATMRQWRSIDPESQWTDKRFPIFSARISRWISGRASARSSNEPTSCHLIIAHIDTVTLRRRLFSPPFTFFSREYDRLKLDSIQKRIRFIAALKDFYYLPDTREIEIEYFQSFTRRWLFSIRFHYLKINCVFGAWRSIFEWYTGWLKISYCPWNDIILGEF